MAVTKTENNVGTVKRIYESFVAGDVDAVVATWAPDIEFNAPEGLIGGGTFHGPGEILENVFAELAKNWEETSAVPEQFVDGGDTVDALMTWSGTSTETGKDVENPGAHVFEFEDGMIARWTSDADTALFNAALEA